MSKHNEYTIKVLVDLWLKQQFHVQRRIQEIEVVKSWPLVMGNMVARHTADVYIYQGALTVRLNSASLRQELSYNKKKIMQLLNDNVGGVVVKELILQ